MPYSINSDSTLFLETFRWKSSKFSRSSLESAFQQTMLKIRENRCEDLIYFFIDMEIEPNYTRRSFFSLSLYISGKERRSREIVNHGKTIR